MKKSISRRRFFAPADSEVDSSAMCHKRTLPPYLFRLYSVAMKSANPPGVGLGGDGDEIAAVERIEACFGVKLDDGTASTWLTAGDVYRALCNELPVGAGDKPETWNRFVQALAEETGGDPNLIEPDSLLLGAAPGSTKVAIITTAVVAAMVVSAAGFSIKMIRCLLWVRSGLQSQMSSCRSR